MERLASRLKKIRAKLDLNQKDFADSIATTQAAISRYEKGLRLPTADFLHKICEIHKINMNWFLSGTGEMFLSVEKKIEKNIIPRKTLSSKTTENENKELYKDIKKIYEDYVQQLKKMVAMQEKLIKNIENKS